MPTIDVAYSYRTYKMTEGKLSTTSLIKKAKEEAVQMWGVENIFVIEPTIKQGKLPAWTNMVWANGAPIASDDDEHYSGSEVIVLWWSEITPDQERVLQAVDWKKIAKNYTNGSI